MIRKLLLTFVVTCLTGAITCRALEQLPSKKNNLAAEDRRAWEAFLGLPEECTRESRDDLGWIKFYKSVPATYVIEVACNFGAYQGTQVYYWFDETSGKAQLLKFDNYQDDGEKIQKALRSELAGISKWKMKKLTIFDKFRGLGDCGIYQVYNFVNGQPQLADARLKKKCDGKIIHNWSVIPQLR